MKPNRHHILLTDEERDLVDKIDLRCPLPREADQRAIFLANEKPVIELLRLLDEREAIPRQRIAYWTDPDYKPGQTKGSRKQMFERNGNVGDEIYTHPHFVPYLRYFLYGADLPQGAIDEFEEQVGDVRGFSGSDILGLTKKTRELVRKYDLRSHADEFYQLTIDNGLSRYSAESVRNAAKEASRR